MTLAAAMLAVATVALAIAMGRVAREVGSRLRASAFDRPSDALADMFIFVAPGRLLVLSIASALLAALSIAVVTRTAAAALLVALGTMAAPRLAQAWLLRARLQKLAIQLPDALGALTSALRSGAGLVQALGDLAHRLPRPLSHEIELALRKQRLGVPLERALRDLAARIPLSGYRLFVSAVCLGLTVGGSITEALDRLAATLRRTQAMDAKIRALTSQSRLQAVIVTSLPLLLMAALTWIDPASMSPLFDTPAGWITLAAIAVLETAGWLLMRKIAAIDV